jgi:hypothetical protein
VTAGFQHFAFTGTVRHHGSERAVRIVMTLLVRDEEDIVEANLRYHFSQGVDFVIATDNASRDHTRAILLRYARTGHLKLIDEPGDDYSQDRWVTRMARLACIEYGADWVINNDADEFWWPRQGNLRTVLSTVARETGGLRVRRTNFRPVTDEHGPFFERMVLRERVSLTLLGQPLPSKVCHRAAADIEVGQGNHSVSGSIGRTVDTDSIEILHFPLRTYAQFENKIRVGGAAYERNRRLPRGVGETWRVLYQEYRAGRLPERYGCWLVDGERAGQGLATGELIKDVRLRDHLRGLEQLDGGPRSAAGATNWFGTAG